MEKLTKDLKTEGLVFEAPEKLNPDSYPAAFNLSAEHFFQFVPVPKEILPPEFVYVPLPKSPRFTDEEVAISNWNLMWEAGHLRPQGVVELPNSLSWVKDFQGTNLYLLPGGSPHRYETLGVLFHLLPQKTVEMFGLRPMKQIVWPPALRNVHAREVLTRDFSARLAKAFAFQVWPLLNKRSNIKAFSKDDPLVLLSHNLDYWLPFAYTMAENRLRTFLRVGFENNGQRKKLERLRRRMPDGVEANLPRSGGWLWQGEAEAREALTEVVEAADRHGRLRSIMEAITENRVEDDFSSRWSYEREDFERKLHHKRLKIKVSFVELDETIPVHGPDSELEDNLLWEDFLTLLNRKERSITVCLRNGFTKAGEISTILGYANHSPVSKALKRIRQKAMKYFERN